MKHIYKNLSLILAFVLAGQLLLAQESEVQVHTATNSNCTFNYTILDHPNLNAQPASYPIFTHNFNPGGGSGTYADLKMGIWYNGTTWKIFNENKDAFLQNTNYNVLIPGPDVKSWKVIADSNNTVLNRATIDHPLLNGDPNAIVLLSSTWSGVYDTNVNGVYYDNTAKKWKVYNQGGPGESMKQGTEFNVVIPQTSSKYKSFVHQTSVQNTTGYITKINDPDLNYNPNAVLFITQNYNPGGVGGVYNNHNVGVYYNGTQWCIYNEDKVAIPDGAAFNVLAFELSPTTSIDKPLTTKDVKVFPNPASVHDPITISLDNEMAGAINIRLIASNGTCVYNETVNKASGRVTHQIQSQNLPRGLYIVRLENGGQVGTQKMIIQ